MLHLWAEKGPCPDAFAQDSKTGAFRLSVPNNPQKVPAAFGKTVGAPFDSLLPVEVGLVPKRVEVSINPLYIVQRDIGAYIDFCGVNHLTLAR